MFNYIKKLIIRLVISLTVIGGILFGGELILRCIYSDDWAHENKIINNMNIEKLQNKDWGSNALWLHEGDKISPKKEGVKRIFIVGDSNVWGDGYTNANHIWWQQFKHLVKENDYENVEVIAAGLGGYSTKQQFENIIKNKEIMEKVDPDLIVIAYVQNDPEFRDKNRYLLVKNLISEDLFSDSKNKFVTTIKKYFPNLYTKSSLLISNKFYNNSTFRQMFGLPWDDWIQTISSGNWLEKYKNEIIIPMDEYIKNELNIPYFFYATVAYDEQPIYNIFNMLEENDIENYYASSFAKQIGIEVNEDVSYRKINPGNWHASVYDGNLFSKLLLEILEENYPFILGEVSGKYEPQLNINDWMPYSLQPKKTSNNTYSIIYPSKNDKNSFLRLPIKKDYVKLNLEDPIDINSIKITGNDIEEIEIFVNVIDPNLGYDSQEMFSLGSRKDEFNWDNLNRKKVTSINISAKTKDNKSTPITIEFD